MAKRSLAKGVIAGTATLVAYVLVVIATTPSLPASAAAGAAFDINSPIILGTTGAVGAQIFFTSYGKSLGCAIDRKRAIFGAGTGSTAIGSFFSFFCLCPLAVAEAGFSYCRSCLPCLAVRFPSRSSSIRSPFRMARLQQ